MDQLYEEVNIPTKGRGLVARRDIRSGTRILCERPLLILRCASDELMHRDACSKLRTLSREEQRQFLSLHNNSPGRYAFAGIVKTNALPCGPGANTGGVYLKISLINHSCLPNSHNSWNDDTGREAIHARRDILAGEEITVSYDRGGPISERHAHLQSNFGFTCQCELCTLPSEELRASDNRRRRIQELDEKLGDPFAMSMGPLVILRIHQTLLGVLNEEYGPHNTPALARLYYGACQIVIAHGDQARATVFAKRSYKARAGCEGEDSPDTKEIKGFMDNSASHPCFALVSKRWRTSKTSQPRQLDEDEFEKWLWRYQN
ncbi:SET domain-containing protein [Xylaria longipes]|nr:SET domain-containing protein [Xylaria longipes]